MSRAACCQTGFVEDAVDGDRRGRRVDARERDMYLIVAAAVDGRGERKDERGDQGSRVLVQGSKGTRTTIQFRSMQFDEAQGLASRLRDELGRAIIGQQAVVQEILTAFFAGGHVLLRGVPGLAKTLLIKTLAQAVHLKFNRIQFTPDLMPSDIIGTEVIEEDRVTGRREIRFIPGPIFANVILADEINRTPPKTQAALLEAMQEYQVTVNGVRYELDAAAVRAGDAEPDRAGRHLPAAGGAARSLHVQRRHRLSVEGGGARHPRADDRRRASR